MFVSNNCTNICSNSSLEVKENLVKQEKLSKHHESDYLQNFIYVFMFLLSAEFVINGLIYNRIYLVSFGNILKQT